MSANCLIHVCRTRPHGRLACIRRKSCNMQRAASLTLNTLCLGWPYYSLDVRIIKNQLNQKMLSSKAYIYRRGIKRSGVPVLLIFHLQYLQEEAQQSESQGATSTHNTKAQYSYSQFPRKERNEIRQTRESKCAGTEKPYITNETLEQQELYSTPCANTLFSSSLFCISGSSLFAV